MIAAMGLAGCDALTGPSELERTIALEQRAIAAHAAEIPSVDVLARAFAEAWRRANNHRDLAVYRSDLNAHAIVAGRALLTGLDAMPLGSSDLKALHEPLITAYRRVIEALEAFVGGPPAAAFEGAYAPVLVAYEGLRAAESIYRRGIETWYAKNRMTLVAGPDSSHLEPEVDGGPR